MCPKRVAKVYNFACLVFSAKDCCFNNMPDPTHKNGEKHLKNMSCCCCVCNCMLSTILVISQSSFLILRYRKTCVKQPLLKSPRIGFQDQLSLYAGQKYCRMLQGGHSAILLTFIKLSFVMMIFVLSIF